MSAKKFISVILVLIAFCLVFNVAKAVTAEELLKEIARLQALIAQLQKQLAELQGKPAAWCHDFNVNLKIGDSGLEVEALQTALEKEGFDVSKDPKGYFGEYTASAVVGFQEKYKDEILTPLRLKHGTGFVGKATRAKLNSLYGCKVVPPSIKPSIRVLSPNGGEVWEIGKSYVVRWKSEGISKVNILLIDYRAPESCYLNENKIDANLGYFKIENLSKVKCYPGMGEMEIVDISPGSQYKIKIEDAENPQVSDFSDNYFSIIAPTSPLITIIFPNGGEKWIIGNTYTIKWKSMGVKNIYLILKNPKIEETCYFNPEIETLYSPRPIPAELGEYTVKLERVHCYGGMGGWSWKNIEPDNQYKIEIRTEIEGIKDESDNYFSIVTSTPWIKVISPNGGERWEIGKTYNIKWESAGVGKVYITLFNYDQQDSCRLTYESIVNTGSYSFVPGQQGRCPQSIFIGNRMKIEVSADVNTTNGIEVKDDSDNYFSIVSP
jgi:hypothetical protein